MILEKVTNLDISCVSTCQFAELEVSAKTTSVGLKELMSGSKQQQMCFTQKMVS